MKLRFGTMPGEALAAKINLTCECSVPPDADVVFAGIVAVGNPVSRSRFLAEGPWAPLLSTPQTRRRFMALSEELDYRGDRAFLAYGGLRCLLRAIAAAGAGERVYVGEALRALGTAGIAGALLIPSLVALSPATAILGVASVCGAAIAFLTAQLILQRDALWLPRALCSRSVHRRHLVWVEQKIGPMLDWIEHRSRARWSFLIQRPLGYVPGVVCFALGMSMPFLELVPLSASTIGAAVTVMVIGLLLGDGLIVGLGLLMSVGVVWLFTAVAQTVFGVFA